MKLYELIPVFWSRRRGFDSCYVFVFVFVCLTTLGRASVGVRYHCGTAFDLRDPGSIPGSVQPRFGASGDVGFAQQRRNKRRH